MTSSSRRASAHSGRVLPVIQRSSCPPDKAVSICPLKSSVGPPPVPGITPTTLARPGSVCWRKVSMPCFWSQSWMNRATSSSLPVGVGKLTTSMANWASSSRSMWKKPFAGSLHRFACMQLLRWIAAKATGVARTASSIAGPGRPERPARSEFDTARPHRLFSVFAQEPSVSFRQTAWSPDVRGLCRTGLRQLTATSLERPIKQEAAKWVMQICMSI